jgi:hypothetical protein
VTFSSITTVGTSTTLTFDPNLSANTTYYVRVGSLWNGATTYADASPASTSTLAIPIVNSRIHEVHVTSVTVNWSAVSAGQANGYRLEYSTMAAFEPLWLSSVTSVISLSTLTATSLIGDNTYYFRVGGLNWNNVYNYTLAFSTYVAPVLSVEIDADAYSFGSIIMSSSVVSTTTISVHNSGNRAATWSLQASTQAASAWVISTTTVTNFI